MKNTFIAAVLIFWGFVVAVVSASYVLRQNRIAQEAMQKTYTESVKQIVESVNKGKVSSAPLQVAASAQVVTSPASQATKPVIQKVTPVVATSKVTPSQASTPEPSKPAGLTMDTVALHSTQSDCWIVINGNVYSVASYIPMHPGGARRIINLCGRDATNGYDGQGHSSYADSLLGGYLVGPLQ